MSEITADIRKTTEEVDAAIPVVQYACLGNDKKSYLLIKRAMDIVLAILAGAALLIPMSVVALLIVIEDPGPVFYTQERLGKYGKPFRMIKFRSMRVDAEKNGPQWACAHDPRCTKVGVIIRRWHIDEIPQLVNILKGDMSIVGPRPERVHFYKEFEKELPHYWQRLAVDQGLTCIGQVRLYGADLTPENKIACDLEYIKHQSLMLDIKCMVKTLWAIVKNKGE